MRTRESSRLEFGGFLEGLENGRVILFAKHFNSADIGSTSAAVGTRSHSLDLFEESSEVNEDRQQIYHLLCDGTLNRE